MKIDEIDYHGWETVRLDTGEVELLIPKAVGPRILSARYKGGPNLFKEFADQMGGSGESEWKCRGGHRLWHAPEQDGRTYDLDNVPIQVVEDQDREGEVSFIAPHDPVSATTKQIDVRALNERTFEISHFIAYKGIWPTKLASWGVTVMAPGGIGVVPLLPKVPHGQALLPSYHLVPWTYTDFSLPCWTIAKDYIIIQQSGTPGPQKIGLSDNPGWMAYWQEGGTFVKAFSTGSPDLTFPDRGSSLEVYLDPAILELEVLGPMEDAEAVESEDEVSAFHIEIWTFLEGIEKPDSQEAIEASLKPAVEEWLNGLDGGDDA